MKTEKELKDFLYKCESVITYGMSHCPCPFKDYGAKGCCAKCSTPATIRWVLGTNEITTEEEPQAFKTNKEKEEISRMAFDAVYCDKLKEKK